MLAALLLACVATSRPPRVDPEVLPTLPSPRGDVYGHGAATPKDPLVARVAEGVTWDEALSGAAAGVALALLSGQPADAATVRWKAVLAGYPYPVVAKTVAVSDHGEVPGALVAEARRQAGEGIDLGIVRARGREQDVWVMLVGERRAELPPVPREVAVGDAIALGAGAEWTVADPFGAVRRVAGDLVADAEGEWLLRATVGGDVVATFPVYAGTRTPEAPPLAVTASGATPEALARATVDAVRDAYGLAPYAADAALDSVARSRMRTLREGGEPPAAEGQLRAAGFVDGAVAGAWCRAATVNACLDQLWWSVERRGVLVGDYGSVGVAAATEGAEVVLSLVVAG